MARSTMKLIFYLEVPKSRKISKTSKSGRFIHIGLIKVVFGIFLNYGTSKLKTDFSALLATPRPLDRHPTCLCFKPYNFWPYNRDF